MKDSLLTDKNKAEINSAIKKADLKRPYLFSKNIKPVMRIQPKQKIKDLS